MSPSLEKVANSNYSQAGDAMQLLPLPKHDTQNL